MRRLRDLILYCDRPSDSVRELADRLSARRLFGEARRKLRLTNGSLVLNYGTSHSPSWSFGDKSVVINHPDKIINSISKVKSHALFTDSGIPRLEQTIDRELASKWVQEGSAVLCRRDGLSGGRGITFVPKGSPGPLPQSDFYTKYFPKTHEYRAHVVRGRLIDLTQKRLKNGATKDETDASEAKVVRSLENGWIHAHEFTIDQGTRDSIEKAAVQAVEALGLDFGAVDILFMEPRKKGNKPARLAVCEVNSAPGLSNEPTLNAYVEAIKQWYSDTASDRAVSLRKRRKKVRKLVKVWITTRKGNRVQRERPLWVHADKG